jgi:hypothetical protein
MHRVACIDCSMRATKRLEAVMEENSPAICIRQRSVSFQRFRRASDRVQRANGRRGSSCGGAAGNPAWLWHSSESSRKVDLDDHAHARIRFRVSRLLPDDRRSGTGREPTATHLCQSSCRRDLLMVEARPLHSCSVPGIAEEPSPIPWTRQPGLRGRSLFPALRECLS